MRKSWVVFTIVGLVFSFALYAGGGKEGKYCDFSKAECAKHIKEYYSSHGWLGVEKEKTEDGRYVITKVLTDSPAEKAGLAVGDEILAYNGADITDHDAVKAAKKKMTIGSELTLTVRRDGAKREIMAALTAIPEPVLEARINRHLTEDHEVASKK